MKQPQGCPPRHKVCSYEYTPHFTLLNPTQVPYMTLMIEAHIYLQAPVL